MFSKLLNIFSKNSGNQRLYDIAFDLGMLYAFGGFEALLDKEYNKHTNEDCYNSLIEIGAINSANALKKMLEQNLKFNKVNYSLLIEFEKDSILYIAIEYQKKHSNIKKAPN